MATLTADHWALAAARRLASHGVDQVRVEPLAVALGVSKGSFYWHFANRDALLAAVLDLWESQGTEAIIAAVDAGAADAPTRLRALIRQTFGQPEHDGIELGIRAWARHDARARATAERVDARRLDYVASLVEGCGVTTAQAHTRAEFMYRTLIGEFVLRSQGRPPLSEETLTALGNSMIAPE